jgi:hypothetical protein
MVDHEEPVKVASRKTGILNVEVLDDSRNMGLFFSRNGKELMERLIVIFFF